MHTVAGDFEERAVDLLVAREEFAILLINCTQGTCTIIRTTGEGKKYVERKLFSFLSFSLPPLLLFPHTLVSTSVWWRSEAVATTAPAPAAGCATCGKSFIGIKRHCEFESLSEAW